MASGLPATLDDPCLERSLCEDGFVVVPDIARKALPELERSWRQCRPNSPEPLYFSTGRDDVEHRRRVAAQVVGVLGPCLAPLFCDHRPALGVFVAKQPRSDSAMSFHHDISFIDETAATTAVAWVPMSDVSEANGALRVLPGSHRAVTTPRGTPTFPGPFREVDDAVLDEHVVTLRISPGSVVISDARLGHASSPNRSADERVVAVTAWVPRTAPLRHYFHHGDGRVEVFSVDDAFFTEFDLVTPPRRATSLGTVHVEFPVVDIEAGPTAWGLDAAGEVQQVW